jgi:hypothetical protein
MPVMTDCEGMPSDTSASLAARPGHPARNEITSTFGWGNMFLPPEEDPRTDSYLTGELEILASYLADYRMTLEIKCAGLDAADMACRSVPPSDLTLLGLVRHMADVESNWFRHVMDRQATRWVFRTEDDSKLAFTGVAADPEAVAAAWAAWREQVAFGERYLKEAPSLDVTGISKGEEISLREVLVHLIEEYARHCGHADLLRECIDGRAGL